MDRLFPLLGLIPMALGIVFASIGWVLGGYPRRGWQRTSGVAVFSWQLFSGGLKYRWTTPGGEERTSPTYFRTSWLRDGDPVTVLFNPKRPYRSVLDTPLQNGLAFLIIGAGIGLLSVFVTLMLFWLSTVLTR